MLSPEILEKLKIDECDLPLFNSHRWRAGSWDGKYLTTDIRLPDGRWTCGKLHRMILNAPSGMQVDHINGDTFDNRRANLRVCTISQNQLNRRKSSGKSSIYKGVSWRKNIGKWEAYITIDGIQKNLGCYIEEIEAARAYDTAATKHFGVFANLNFPNLAVFKEPL